MADEIKKEEQAETEAVKAAAEAAKKEEQAQPAPKTPEDILKEKDDKINELTDKYLRSLAELDNYRKRMQKEKEDFVKYTRGEAVSLFLPVIDNFERALASTAKVKDFDQLKKGIDMVIKQFESALKEMGAKEIPATGIFDPVYHHAMHKEHAEGKKDGEIIEVYQKGYMIDDKIIRPAMVKIVHNEGHKEHNHKEHNEKHGK
ncbi:MAG: nucleotide exchange factor GrpE [Candidatus Goldiibacteriota bacterium]